MENGNPLIEIALMLLSAGGIYGAIRNDLKNIHERINENMRKADAAHERIDEILLRRQNKEG